MATRSWSFALLVLFLSAACTFRCQATTHGNHTGDCPSDLAACEVDGTGREAAREEPLSDPGSAALRRSLLASVPSSQTNGSAAVAFPSSRFADWCATDAACAAAPSLSLALLHERDVSAVTASTLNWPNVLSGTDASSPALASDGLVELQLPDLPGRRDADLCGGAAVPCTATLTIPMLSTGAAGAGRAYVCMRLEPTVLGTSYQAFGYPPGSNGTAVLDAIPVNGAMRCSTTRFGKHIIMSYTRGPVPPPSPPAASPPPPSPPPPLINETGLVYEDDVRLRLETVVAVGFPALAANDSLVAHLTASLDAALAQALGVALPRQLLLTRAAGAELLLISRFSFPEDPGPSNTSVTLAWRVVVPAPVTEGQVQALKEAVRTNYTAMFANTSYASRILGVTIAPEVPPTKSKPLSGAEVAGVALAAVIAFELLVLAVVLCVRRSRRNKLLPPEPQGPWDKYGKEVVAPGGEAARRRRDAAARRQKALEEGLNSPLEGAGPNHQPGGRAIPPWEAGGGGGAGVAAPGHAAGAGAAAFGGAGHGAPARAPYGSRSGSPEGSRAGPDPVGTSGPSGSSSRPAARASLTGDHAWAGAAGPSAAAHGHGHAHGHRRLSAVGHSHDLDDPAGGAAASHGAGPGRRGSRMQPEGGGPPEPGLVAGSGAVVPLAVRHSRLSGLIVGEAGAGGSVTAEQQGRRASVLQGRLQGSRGPAAIPGRPEE
ncbi:hypothetical protein HYH03_013128 [Edaphochlamys debaryana]|uniref:Uncharacterized protein n=1 Tax=Edaphochlamys debaryana TaxID=47281 RepID=A0A836BUR4_9CHLO|nr:hypothetical protein HYH03_013128 [Edaphochlamys debaryana]|eukprot:KAG2488278.1 hypothetical protein HYH03_013128 [Edaphochlamys debaryana]